MRIYLAVRPEEVRSAQSVSLPLAHAAYRIGTGSSLLSRNLLLQTQGGLLVLSDRDAPPLPDPEALSAALLRECSRRAYSGIVLDLDAPFRADLGQLAAALTRAGAHSRRRIYVPESYAPAAPDAAVILNTAISGGNFEEHLRQCCGQYGGAQNVALDIQCLRMDFTLPAPSGQGIPLTAEALTARLDAYRPAVFFSQDLCARYFTCTQDGIAHFILFDDAGTLRQKLRLGRQLGIPTAFFQWPEIQEIASDLFQPT